jgi:PelA/Pel-15E family pectate lyase
MATEVALALIYGQLQSGGWTNCIDFDPQGTRVARYRSGQGRGRNFSSLDDDQSQSAIRLLIRVDRAHQFQHAAIHDAVNIALDALLMAQFANGAFPQGWEGPVEGEQPQVRARLPDDDWRTAERIKNYWDMYTLNDGLAGSVGKALIEAHETYHDEQYKTALMRLGDFLLLAQLPEPQPAWCQQYNYQMQPIWARRFEPPAISGHESQDVLLALIAIHQYTGDPKYLEPVPRAIRYLRGSLLPDGRLSRYYELRTNRPLYMRRRGNEYSLTYDDSDLPAHYSWKTKPRLDEIESLHGAALHGASLPGDAQERPTADSLAQRAQSILDALDPQGRWISTFGGERLAGSPQFQPGDHYISSAVFSENLELLSEYLSLVQDSGIRQTPTRD